jgi:hypothetical protein
MQGISRFSGRSAMRHVSGCRGAAKGAYVSQGRDGDTQDKPKNGTELRESCHETRTGRNQPSVGRCQVTPTLLLAHASANHRVGLPDGRAAARTRSRSSGTTRPSVLRLSVCRCLRGRSLLLTGESRGWPPWLYEDSPSPPNQAAASPTAGELQDVAADERP